MGSENVYKRQAPAELAANGPYSESTLANRRSLGLPPDSYRIGRRVFYDPDVVDAWIAAERAKSARE